MPRTIDDLQKGFRLGPWTVRPDLDQLIKGKTVEHLEPMVMEVLVVLASADGQVVSKDQLVDAVWGGRLTADETIVAKIAILRNRLGDDSRDPEYIKTLSKKGYQLLMPADIQNDDARPSRKTLSTRPLFVGIAAAFTVAVLAAVVFWPHADPINSVAVLQFKNLSDDEERFQYFVDGFSEELVVSLSQVPSLKFARGPGNFAGQTTREIASSLGVDAIVSGSMRTDGDKVRIVAELISKDGFQLWTNSIDGAAQDIFGFQELVATELRDALLGKKEQPVRAAGRPATPAAYDKYMRGLFFLAKRDRASLGFAQNLFQETIQIDPNFGPAYLRQAITLLLLADYLPDRRADIFANALDVANLGADMDASVSDAMQVVHGFVYHQRGDWAESALAFDRAFRSETQYPTAYQWHSRLLGDLGFSEQSLQQALAARALEPASQVSTSRVAIAYMWKNDMDSARKYFDEANSMNVGAPDHHIAYSFFLIRDDRLDEAKNSINFALSLANRDNWWVDVIFDALNNPDDQERQQIAFSTIDGMSSDEAMPPYVMMTIWALFDNGDKIIEIALQQAREVGVIYELETIFLDEFDVLRDHPDFPQFLSAIGLTDYWNSVGCIWQTQQLVCHAE